MLQQSWRRNQPPRGGSFGMEGYNGSEQGTPETYMIQGTESNLHLTTTPPLQQIELMDNGGTPEYIVDQGLYYPAATNYYGYYPTGSESTGELDDQHRFIGLDGHDYQYAGIQTENMPYVYYTPSYGYAQSLYNPYNPYIPGAIIGVDGSFVGMQQYYPGAAYQQSASSPVYYPLVVQPGAENVLNNSLEPFLNSGPQNVNGSDGLGLKPNPTPATAGTVKASTKPTSGDMRSKPGETAFPQSHSLGKRSDFSKANATPSKQAAMRTNTTGSVPDATSTQTTQGRTASSSVQAVNQFSLGQASSLRNPVRVSLPVTSGLPDFGSNNHRWAVVDKPRPRLHGGGVLNNGSGNSDFFGEQRGPRTNRSKNQWAPSVSIEAHAATSGSTSAHGNIIIHADQYNKEDFCVDYTDAKFFVIKSYSEDDVHKSIKYNVWSSTINGNKRLESAYEDAQRIGTGKPKGCPIFLFFSVNASGQFCGVAEMIGPVDFDKDMNFWQQDKWSGSFPVKWHIVKDVPNANFRHIILENNENKPVTNSRDTQEIKFKQGMEMLNIFKNFMLKTSILDDFIYYEERQKILQEEKARLLGKNYNSSSFVPAFIPKNPNGMVDKPPSSDEKSSQDNHSESSGRTTAATDGQVPPKLGTPISSSSGEVDSKKIFIGSPSDVTTDLNIGSLTIETKQAEPKPSAAAVTVASTEAVDVVTVGSVPVKVNSFSEASHGILTIGTIPIAPKALTPGGKPNTGPSSASGA